MKRRITALMITLCMVLTMMPLHVHATEAGHVHYGGEATCRWKATCKGCGSIYGETDPNNHNDYFGEDNGDGRTHTAMCTCGHIYNASEPHDFSGWEEDGPGQEARFCYECYYTETRSTHTHSYSDATCTTPATCSCNATQGDVDKNNHVGGTEIRNQVDAGEFTDGYTGDTYCLGCGDKISSGSTIPATHTHVWEWTYDGELHWQKCFGCGESSTAAQAHQFDDDADATCDTCGYTRTVHTHDYTAVVTAPTCSAQGYTTYTCSCGDSYMGDYVAAVDHNWGEWTFNGDGTHARTCLTDSSHTENGGCTSYGWKYNEKEHSRKWHCDACGGGYDRDIALSNPYHVYANDTDLTCDLCGYVRTVEGSLSITGSMSAATVGEAYSASFGYTGTVSGVVFWNATGLPDGLSINAGSGVVSGTPTTAGTYSVTISMGATGGGSASKSFSLTVNEPAHTHSYSIANCQTPATCLCGETTGDVDKSNHVGGTEIRGQVNAGEFTEGYTGDTYCLGCGEKISSGSTIPATHTHTWEWDYDSTLHWQKCDCGESSTAAEGHLYDDDTDATCNKCGYTRTIEHTHEWGKYESNGDGSHTRICTTDNSHRQKEDCGGTATCHELATCPGCGASHGEYDKNNHVGGTEIRNDVAAGEFTDGYTGDTYCLGCGDLLSEGKTIPATHVHSYSIQYSDIHHWDECSCGDTRNLEGHYGYGDDSSCDHCSCHVHFLESST